jgi:hypothetical protein
MNSWTLQKGETILLSTSMTNLAEGGREELRPQQRRRISSYFPIPTSDMSMGIETDGMAAIICTQEKGRQETSRWLEETKPFETMCKMGRLFDCSGERAEITYAGEFRLDHVHPLTSEKSQASGGGGQRNVIIFRLLEGS